MSAVSGARTSRFVETVLADRPSRPWVRKSSTASWTVYLGDERTPSPQFVVHELEIVLDLSLGPATDLAADPPAIGPEAQRDRATPSPQAAPVMVRIAALGGVIEVDRVLAPPASLAVRHARNGSTWLPIWLPGGPGSRSTCALTWSGWPDSNRRPPAPKAGA